MDDIERLKQDVREGRIPADRRVELVVRQQRGLQAVDRGSGGKARRLGDG
jgi:hypothetical protein